MGRGQTGADRTCLDAALAGERNVERPLFKLIHFRGSIGLVAIIDKLPLKFFVPDSSPGPVERQQRVVELPSRQHTFNGRSGRWD